jgi:hypothetical protein
LPLSPVAIISAFTVGRVAANEAERMETKKEGNASFAGSLN